MKAAILAAPRPIASSPLEIADLPIPEPAPGHVLLKVRACGVCRTDLHVVEGELAPRVPNLIPGHQIVGEIVAGSELAQGTRVGVSWLGGTDGSCPYCLRSEENLCDSPTFTGYTTHGGYAQFTTADARFVYPLPDSLTGLQAAPLLCAGIIGFRSIRVASVQPGHRVGLFGFGASAHLALPVLQSWNCEVYVSTRGASHRALAQSLGATWVGSDKDLPPVPLDRAITFAPAGEVVVSALSCLRKGGILAINAIHLDRIPSFDYDSLLWGERQIRSVANMTRADARDFLQIAARIRLQPQVTVFPLSSINQALQALKNDAINGAAVIDPNA